ncbi:MAG: class I SAM-dependent methyltransferase [Anaerolineae bacterium]|nr:class I SAM-dependent methyltransferase [Anaerolineae bacterium]
MVTLNTILPIVLLAVLTFGLALLGWWLFIASEGVYLGRRMVVWLYDLFASRYDGVKDFNPIYEHALLAQPILEHIAPHRAPLVLDVATGTARLPLALLKHKHFQGRVIGVDLSRQMLRRAAAKLRGFEAQTTLLWCPAEHLPFADHTFDVVCSLEALEFMPDPQAALHEMVRVLRPGGLLFVSNRINTKLMPGKTWTRDELAQLLVDCGLADADLEPWQEDYDRVWAIKDGDSEVTGARPLGEILRCPCCPASGMIEHDDRWVCELCPGEARIGTDGVIEWFPLQARC